MVSCRALRACKQYGAKRRAELASERDTKKRGSRRRKRIQRRMNRFKAQQERRQRDMLHKVSRVTRGRRYAFLPFLYDDAAARLRERNAAFVGDQGSAYRAGEAGQAR